MKPSSKNPKFGISEKQLTLTMLVLSIFFTIIPSAVVYFTSNKKDTFSNYYAKNVLNLGIQLIIGYVFLFWLGIYTLLAYLMWNLILVFACIAAYEEKKYRFIQFYRIIK